MKIRRSLIKKLIRYSLVIVGIFTVASTIMASTPPAAYADIIKGTEGGTSLSGSGGPQSNQGVGQCRQAKKYSLVARKFVQKAN